ncbi:hypothetical protein A2313_02965 [Candidatus Roizmanbacteria bacterium RIFOXYB2_FULL_41_10]|nr:MAG: hypothetical protein A2313_02965 [Candidatus Roizmanbacteria bacterium RIFOXYB2_FULL_41_10]
MDLITDTVYAFFKEHFFDLVKKTDLKIHFNLSNASSPGKTEEKESEKGKRKFWFEPRDLDDLPELKSLFSNDTSLGCSYAPLTTLEKTVLSIEGLLNSKKYQKHHPWCGSDIKIMASRILKKIDITFCLPQIANYVYSLQEYKQNIDNSREEVFKIIRNNFPKSEINLNINTRDQYDTGELYLTATGSSIESGDEGLVGRGNRIHGLIPMLQPMSMEGACGKNPVYHVGKLYNIAAYKIANALFNKTGQPVMVFLVSQSGSDLIRPWKTIVCLDSNNLDLKQLIKLVKHELDSIPDITKELLQNKIRLY